MRGRVVENEIKPEYRSDSKWRGFGEIYHVIMVGMAGSRGKNSVWKNAKKPIAWQCNRSQKEQKIKEEVAERYATGLGRERERERGRERNRNGRRKEKNSSQL